MLVTLLQDRVKENPDFFPLVSVSRQRHKYLHMTEAPPAPAWTHPLCHGDVFPGKADSRLPQLPSPALAHRAEPEGQCSLQTGLQRHQCEEFRDLLQRPCWGTTCTPSGHPMAHCSAAPARIHCLAMLRWGRQQKKQKNAGIQIFALALPPKSPTVPVFLSLPHLSLHPDHRLLMSPRLGPPFGSAVF